MIRESSTTQIQQVEHKKNHKNAFLSISNIQCTAVIYSVLLQCIVIMCMPMQSSSVICSALVVLCYEKQFSDVHISRELQWPAMSSLQYSYVQLRVVPRLRIVPACMGVNDIIKRVTLQSLYNEMVEGSYHGEQCRKRTSRHELQHDLPLNESTSSVKIRKWIPSACLMSSTYNTVERWISLQSRKTTWSAFTTILCGCVQSA